MANWAVDEYVDESILVVPIFAGVQKVEKQCSAAELVSAANTIAIRLSAAIPP